MRETVGRLAVATAIVGLTIAGVTAANLLFLGKPDVQAGAYRPKTVDPISDPAAPANRVEANIHCKAGSYADSHQPPLPPCHKLEVKVYVAMVHNQQGQPRGCIAWLPYNRLNVYSTKPTLGVDPPFEIVYRLAEVELTGLAPKPAGKYYIRGLKVTLPGEGVEISDFFASSPENQPPSDTSVKVTVRLDAWRKVPFAHVPDVFFEPSAGGDKTKCHGVDPIIINNAD